MLGGVLKPEGLAYPLPVVITTGDRANWKLKKPEGLTYQNIELVE